MCISRADKVEGLAAVRKKTEKVKLLKLQTNFQCKVLSQTYSDLSVFKFSKNRKQFSVDQLKENLIKILPSDEQATSNTLLDQALQDPNYLVSRRINHRFEVKGELVWFKGTVKRYNSQTKEFLVMYDEEETPCSFQLLEDIESGDLVLDSEAACCQ